MRNLLAKQIKANVAEDDKKSSSGSGVGIPLYGSL